MELLTRFFMDYYWESFFIIMTMGFIVGMIMDITGIDPGLIAIILGFATYESIDSLKSQIREQSIFKKDDLVVELVLDPTFFSKPYLKLTKIKIVKNEKKDLDSVKYENRIEGISVGRIECRIQQREIKASECISNVRNMNKEQLMNYIN